MTTTDPQSPPSNQRGGEEGDRKPSVDSILNQRLGADQDHFLRHVSESEDEFKIRHERSIETTVENGIIVHKVVEAYDQEAPVESLAFKGSTRCPEHQNTERDFSEGDNVVRYRCEDDNCPYKAAVGRRRTDRDVDPMKAEAPIWYRVTVPAGYVESDFDDPNTWESKVEELDGSNIEDFANAVRTLSLRRYIGGVKDYAYVSAEYDEDLNKTEDGYIDTYQCSRCGENRESPTEHEHSHFGTVCPDCDGATVWSPEDADLPADVHDRMAEHNSFTPARIVDLLRDVIFWPQYVVEVNERSENPAFGLEKDISVNDVPPIKTGRQGRRAMSKTDSGRKGTGLRRPSGFAHKLKYWRTVLQDAKETGLVEKLGNSSFEHKDIRWKPTDKGHAVFRKLSRCQTCGGLEVPMLRISTYKVGRSTKKDQNLTTACRSCDQLHSSSDGAMVIESSTGEFQLVGLSKIDYENF